MVMDLNKKTFLLITGASRGIGKTLSISLASKLKDNSCIFILARNKDGLNDTKCAIEKLEKGITVKMLCVDLGQDVDYADLLQKAFDSIECQPTDFEKSFIIHNAGTVGDVSKRAVDSSDVPEWTRYYQLNLFSAIALNCAFFKLFAAVPKIIVNISSKCGIEPFASMGFYCSVKAARDMYFRVLAKETEDEETIVLNYAPGAIDTEMTKEVQALTINKELSLAFKHQRDTKTMLTTTETSQKFIKLLESGNFKSGDHVDYWDF